MEEKEEVKRWRSKKKRKGERTRGRGKERGRMSERRCER